MTGIRTAMRVWSAVKAEVTRHAAWDPLLGLTVLAESGLAPTTVYCYAKLIRQHYPEDFAHVPADAVDQVMQQLEKASNVSPKSMASRPATAAQVRRLIGDLATPEQQAVYRMWTTASRHRDTMHWTQVVHRDERMMCLTNLCPKSDPLGKFPHRKWVPYRSEHDVILYEPTKVSYRALLHWIKQREPLLSCHSFRKGAVQELQRHFQPQCIALLTWHHSPQDVCRGMLPYAVATPRARNSRRVREMVEHLQRLLSGPPALSGGPRVRRP